MELMKKESFMVIALQWAIIVIGFPLIIGNVVYNQIRTWLV
jgi:hypothetical protein